MNQKKKIKGSTYLAAAHLAKDQAGPTPSPAAQPTYPFVIFNLGTEAAPWSTARRPIRRRLVDVPDEGRRPPSSI
jgi:hypothetical protein